MNTRWNDRFINLALEVSNWSKDHKQVGCVIVEQETNKVLSLGFNGMPSWFDDNNLHNIQSDQKGIVITHAEINALKLLLNNQLGDIDESQQEILQDILESTKFMQDMVENELMDSKRKDVAKKYILYSWTN
jgi:deoxycytidylate deaminase